MIDENEPIRELTREEFELLRASIREDRNRRTETRIQSNAKRIAEAELSAGEEGLEIGLKVWTMRKEGCSRTEIRKKLGISHTVLDSCLQEYELRMGMEAGRMMHHYRALDDERIEDMMKRWLPIACAGKVTVERTGRDGEIYTEEDFDRPLKASYWVLHAMSMRLKLLMASRGDAAKEGGTNVLVWLQGVLPGVQKVVQTVEQQAQGREILVMETEAEKNNAS